MPVHTNLLGRTGLCVSEIGFGTWGLGGDAGGAVAYGPTDDVQSVAALQNAFDAGVTFYDTSDFYGFGHSERILGSVFSTKRDQVVIATKVGLVNAMGTQDFSESHIRQSVQASLQRLQTDYVDVLLLHNPPADLLRADSAAIALLAQLRTEGKCRTWGVSLRSPSDGTFAIGRAGAPVIEVNFNLVDQRARQIGLLDLCGQTETGCIIRTPLCFGFLTGHYSSGSVFADSDHRRRWPIEQRQAWVAASQRFHDALAETTGQTEAQIALRYCLSYPSVSTVIPGMLTVDHVTENLGASQLGALSLSDRQGIETAYERQPVFLTEKRPAQHHVREC